jgi:hypothetical protein
MKTTPRAKSTASKSRRSRRTRRSLIKRGMQRRLPRVSRLEVLEERRVLTGPYAPAAEQPGSTAIYMDDDLFVQWADDWQNYQVGDGVDEVFQTPEKALGEAIGDTADIVSLGRGGEITLTFDRPIRNGPGWDFAVFENAFSDTFLELGFVEVSSDGVNFFQFPNDSQTPGQVDAFGSVDPTEVTGFAGKYRLGYGTPFDLEELAGDSPGLNVDYVTHVKIVDITGDGSFHDTSGTPIYDPYPTVSSAGVDLEAIGVIHAVDYSTSLVGFEDVGASLDDESYWNGPDPNGDQQLGPYNDTIVVGQFESDGLGFNNTFSLDYESWTGWAYSNTTDTITAGYLNQFSAVTGVGAEGSPTYGVAFHDASESFAPPTVTRTPQTSDALFHSVAVTNTTYTALSMLNGDSFAKKFGGADGTDPDWFRLTIEGWNEDDQSLGQVDFYLADYRFQDDSLDYVVDEWTEIDISSLGDAASLTFELSSSDVGALGMNTPAFFAMDNVILIQEKIPLDISASAVSEADGMNAAVGWVGRGGVDLNQSVTVYLTSADTSEIEVPPSVTIPAGETTAEFPIHAVDDAIVDGTQTVMLIARADGFADGGASLDVTDDDVPKLTITITPDSVSEADAASPPAATGVVHRNTLDWGQPLVVQLAGDDSSELQVPTSIEIPAGKMSVEFPIDAVDDAVVDGTQTVTITATAEGFLDGSLFVDVLDDDVLSLTVLASPDSMSESTARPTGRFEDVGATIGSESYWNGADGSGGFVTDGVAFNNDYNLDWDSWSGWSFSNMTDTSSPGYTNQYSAVAGGGSLDSAAYGVGFASAFDPSPSIQLTGSTAGMSFHSLMVTNTTYA